MTNQEDEDNQTIQKIVKIILSHFVCQRENPPLDDFSYENAELVRIPIVNPIKEDPEYIAAAIIKSEHQIEGNPIVLFVPGGNENIDDYLYNEDEFVPYGINFCVMDMRGRGYSGGNNKSYGVNEMNDVFSVINYLKENGYQKISIFGRSIGASSAVCAAAKFQDLVCIAIDSPRIYFTKNIVDRISKYGQISTEKVENFLNDAYKIVFEKTGADLSLYEDPYKLAEKITQPICVMHGRSDKNVPFSNSVDLMNLVKSEDKKFYPFIGNHNSFRDFNILFDFIREHNGVTLTKK